MGKNRADLGSDATTAFERPAQGDLIGVFEVTTHRKTAGQSRDRYLKRADQPRQVGRSGLALEVIEVSESRLINSRMRRSSGPMPSIGLIAPPST